MTTPNDVQNQINAVPWTNKQGLVTGATIFSLLTAIVGLFVLYGALAGNNAWTGTNTFSGTFSANVAPSPASSASSLSALLGRVVSLDDATGIHHDGVTDDTAAAQTLLNAVASAGGGTVLVGPHQYAIGSSLNANLQPTSAQFNSSGFTVILTHPELYFYAGEIITLSGFSSPLSQLNGTWQISSVTSGAPGNFVVLTGLTGSQTQTSSGLGQIYADLTIPTNVSLVCPKGLTGQPQTGSFSTEPFTFLTSSYAGLASLWGSKVQGCNVVNSNVASLTSASTLRQNISAQSSFGGTGLTVGTVQSYAKDVELEDMTIVGYSLGISTENADRARFEHLNIDANQCVTSDQSHDVSHFIDIHCFTFANQGTANASGTITGVANNGAGLWRVSTTFASNVVVGDTVYIGGVSGAGSVNNAWAVAATDSSTYVDLSGSNATGTSSYTGTVTNGYPCIKSMTGTSGIGIGDTITGTGIPGGTHVADVLPRQNVICMTANASATNSSVTITTAPVSYSSGGNIYLDATQRSGKAFSWTNGETNSCMDCYSFNHATGFYVGASTLWTNLVNTKVDGQYNDLIKTSIGYQIDSSSVGTTISTCSTNSVGTALVGTSSNTNQAHLITSCVFNDLARTIELGTGRYIITANSGGKGFANSYLGDGVGAIGYPSNSNDLSPSWEYTSSTGAGLIAAGIN